MTRMTRVFALLLGLILCAGLVHAELQTELFKRLPLDSAPLDIAFSQSDGRVFVLLEGGSVQIFSASGQKLDSFEVGSATSLTVSPDGRRLFLGSAKGKELQFIDIAYVYELPVGNSPVKGAEDAAVTITVFSDFQCPYCSRVEPLLDQVQAAYPDQVRTVFKQFPLNMHKFARPAALASLAARNQGKFWELHAKLFANYNKLNDQKIRALAESAGLDMKRFDQDIKNPMLQQEVNADMQLGQKAGVRGTPSIFINGKQAKAKNLAGFKKQIDAELKKIGK
jgi:protein-disulfide isomerase